MHISGGIVVVVVVVVVVLFKVLGASDFEARATRPSESGQEGAGVATGLQVRCIVLRAASATS